jgi:hypothetical protein
MIVDLLFGLLFSILNLVLELIPEFLIEPPAVTCAPTNCVWTPAVTTAGWLKTFDVVLPVGIALWGLVTIFGTRVFASVVQFVRWLWDVLPFKAS